jgi:hypothetical protein
VTSASFSAFSDSKLDRWIVYRLYGLTDEEIAVLEGDIDF